MEEGTRKMANISTATKRATTILAFAALLAASAYGVLGSAAGLAQVSATPPHYPSVALR
jgi:hypothetical protein